MERDIRFSYPNYNGTNGGLWCFDRANSYGEKINHL